MRSLLTTSSCFEFFHPLLIHVLYQTVRQLIEYFESVMKVGTIPREVFRTVTNLHPAEYIRIPFADDSLIPIPALQTSTSENATASLANDYLMLSDIFATGWEALNFAGFKAGDSVAIFGAGPIGLMALHAAKIRGASRVYSVDYVPERLALAEQQGATPINFRDADPVEQIMALEPSGVTRSIDAVGYEQVNRNMTVQSDVITRDMIAVTSTGGGMGTVGVYNMQAANSAVVPRASTIQDTMSFSLADFFFNELKWQAGPSDPIGLAPELVALVTSVVASPGFIVSDVISIEDAPDAYRRFERHEIVKAVIAFD
jgi:threonine dehydrogenase-like Zn-dependent dehydrogenase